jgi:hypothetical protein
VRRLREFLEPRGKKLIPDGGRMGAGATGDHVGHCHASRPEQLDDSLAAVDLTLDAEEMEFINLLWYSLPRVAKAPI